LLSDKLIIKTINLEAPEITFEGGLSGNNLSKILANLNDTTSGPANKYFRSDSQRRKESQQEIGSGRFTIPAQK